MTKLSEIQAKENFFNKKTGDYNLTGYREHLFNMIKTIIDSDDFEENEKIVEINRIFLIGRDCIKSMRKSSYFPTDEEMKRILDVFSVYVDNLETSIPKIIFLDEYIDDPNSSWDEFPNGIEEGKIKNGKILLRPSYFFLNEYGQKLVIYEELAHHALSRAKFYILSEVKNALYYAGEELGDRIIDIRDYHEDEDLQIEIDNIRRKIRDFYYHLQKYPSQALNEGAALFLCEKAIKDEELKKGFVEEIHEINPLKEKWSNGYYYGWKKIGYTTLKKLEKKKPDMIKKLTSIRDDFELFEHAEIDPYSHGKQYTTWYKIMSKDKDKSLMNLEREKDKENVE